jgi:hypothetical protein
MFLQSCQCLLSLNLKVGDELWDVSAVMPMLAFFELEGW